MKKKVQMKKMAGVFLALAILGIGLFPPGNVYAAANQAPDADPVVVVLDPGHGGHDQGARYKWEDVYKRQGCCLCKIRTSAGSGCL